MTGTSLKAYALTRLALVVPMVWILLTLVFLLMRVAPGNPISAALGGHAAPSVIEAITHRLGYDKPMYVQYGDYLWGVLHGDLGHTITDRRAVSSIIVQNGGATLELTVFASLIALGVGLLVGLLAGRYRDTWLDVGGRLFGIVAYATPVFFLGFLAQLVFGIWLGWLPTSGQDSPLTDAFLRIHTHILIIDAIWDGDPGALGDILKHLILPATTLGIVYAGIFIRLVRVNVIRSLKDDYVEAARARGIRERSVVYHYAFRNALVPVVTVVGLQLALLLGGAILTEETFNWPGIGSTLVTYLADRDYAGVQGIVIVFALVVVIASLVIDFVNAFVDPRIRY